MIRQVALFCSTLLLSAGLQAHTSINQPAPDFTLPDSHGEQVQLSSLKGKTVILEWTNHLCPYVQKHYDSNNMQSLQQRYTDQDVVWLSIISSAPGTQGNVTPEQANALTSSRKAKPSHVLLDPTGNVGRDYGAKTTPHIYVIDPEGILRYQGAIDSIKSTNQADIAKAENFLVSAMTALEKGEDVKRPVTAPYGCSVKYE